MVAERMSVDAGLMQKTIDLLNELPARASRALLNALERDVKPIEPARQDPAPAAEPGPDPNG